MGPEYSAFSQSLTSTAPCPDSLRDSRPGPVDAAGRFFSATERVRAGRTALQRGGRDEADSTRSTTAAVVVVSRAGDILASSADEFRLLRQRIYLFPVVFFPAISHSKSARARGAGGVVNRAWRGENQRMVDGARYPS